MGFQTGYRRQTNLCWLNFVLDPDSCSPVKLKSMFSEGFEASSPPVKIASNSFKFGKPVRHFEGHNYNPASPRSMLPHPCCAGIMPPMAMGLYVWLKQRIHSSVLWVRVVFIPCDETVALHSVWITSSIKMQWLICFRKENNSPRRCVYVWI